MNPMRQPAPPTLEQSVSPRRQHDAIYSVLLGVFAFFQSLSVISLWVMAGNPELSAISAWVLRMTAAAHLCFLMIEVAVLLIRIAAPAYRKWPTLALNIILLFLFPLGTALSIYGLWKVDRLTPR